ncbi:MAG: NAD-dependent epimerase/dehydratase family protein [Bacteroidales bacterium]|nr:NAD-dependent epimerase/dehydratase family protein [Bacteroidales bacterium]
MKKILITGGAGFVGYHIAVKLAANTENQITIIDNLSRGKSDDMFNELLEKDNVDFISGDLTQPGFYDKLDTDFDYIYHLAAVIGVKNVMKNPDKVLYVNAISTLNIFEYLRKCTNLKKVLFSSTSEIYAGTLKNFGIDVPTGEEVPLTVEDITTDRTTYALSKMYGESICFVYGRKYNVPFSIVRYHNVYGPRMGFAHVIPEMFIKITEKEVVEVASPTHTRAFCYIDDAVEMTIRSCEYESTLNEIVHVGNSSQEITIMQLAETVRNVLGRSTVLTGTEDTAGSPSRRCPDISKIVRLTKYEPQTSVEQGIAKTYEWYKTRLQEVYE